MIGSGEQVGRLVQRSRPCDWADRAGKAIGSEEQVRRLCRTSRSGDWVGRAGRVFESESMPSNWVGSAGWAIMQDSI